MDQILVALIVAAAVAFTIRGFIRAYKGEGGCKCSGCSCSSKNACPPDFPMDPNKI